MKISHSHRPAFLGMIALILALAGCSGPKRVAIAAAKYPAAFAHACADRFPVRDSISTHTEYIPGQVQYLPGDTVTVDCDTVREYLAGGTVTRTVRVPCPPQLLRVDTFNQISFHQVENTARVASLQQDLARETAAAAQARSWRAAFVFALVAALFLLYFLSRSWVTRNVHPQNPLS